MAVAVMAVDARAARRAGHPQQGGIVPSINIIRRPPGDAHFPHLQPSKKGEYRGVFERAAVPGVGHAPPKRSRAIQAKEGLPAPVSRDCHQPVARGGFRSGVQQSSDGGARPGHVDGEDQGQRCRGRNAGMAAAVPVQGREPGGDGGRGSGERRLLPAAQHPLGQGSRVRPDDGDGGRTARGLPGALQEGGAVVHQTGFGHASQPGRPAPGKNDSVEFHRSSVTGYGCCPGAAAGVRRVKRRIPAGGKGPRQASASPAP